jgi:hypothetical protein
MVTFQTLKHYQWKIKIKKKIPMVTFKFFKRYQRKFQKKKKFHW